VYQWLSQQPAETVVLELPMPDPSVLWMYETTYSYNSIFHWRKLANGYSAFAPPAYLQTLELMRAFPNDQSIRRLQRTGVDYVIVHKGYLAPEQYDALVAAMRDRDEFGTRLIFGRGDEEVSVFPLRNQAAGRRATSAVPPTGRARLSVPTRAAVPLQLDRYAPPQG
jgi:hypothetical protein